jgi:transposase InsO family protein
MVENQIGNKSKVLRSDNGGEYTSNEFKNFFNKKWIKRETLLPYKPQQNGASKRKNQTILEASREMLHDQDLPL